MTATAAAKRVVTAATTQLFVSLPPALRPAVARAMPGNSFWFGPPRRWMRNADYAHRYGGTWQVIHPQHLMNRPPPKRVGGALSPMFFMDPWRGPSPDAGVLAIEQARVYGTNGIVGRGDIYLPEEGFFGSRGRSVGQGWVYRKSWTPPGTPLPGTTLALVSEWADDNYFHFLVDTCARLDLFLRAGHRFEDVDHVYLPALDSPAVRTIVERLGLPADKIVRTREAPVIDCERLIAPSFPGASNSTPDWAVAFLRSRLLPDPPPERGRPLFVSRRGATRNLRQSEALEAWLAERGFDILIPGRSPGDIERFAAAPVVVGVFGAGMANIIFCRPGTPVLEIMPPYYQTAALYSLAAAARLDYWAYCPDVPPMKYSHEGYRALRCQDFDLPVPALQDAIRRLRLA